MDIKTNQCLVEDSCAFASIEDDKEDIYPVTISKISSEQYDDCDLKDYLKTKTPKEDLNKRFYPEIMDDVNVLI